MAAVGRSITEEYDRPKAILALSGHWYTRGTYVQKTDEPRQVYDMYGFPQELYEVEYPVKGDGELSDRVLSILGDDVSIDNSWGIDHGTWTVLVHMFPDADIPVVQLSVDGTLSTDKMYEIGHKLSALRDEGYLIFASGNVVHNLRLVQWDNPDGTEMAHRFNDYIVDAVLAGEHEKVINYQDGPDSRYAVPTPDHYIPLIYAIGAAGNDKAEVFNKVCNLGSMAMTGFVFK